MKVQLKHLISPNLHDAVDLLVICILFIVVVTVCESPSLLGKMVIVHETALLYDILE